MNFANLTADFFLKSFKIYENIFFVCFDFSCYMNLNFFMTFLHILPEQTFGLQSFFFCLKIFKFSAFFNSTGKSFQRFALIVVTISKQNLPFLMFCLFTVAPDLRLLELFSLKLNLSLIMRKKAHFYFIYFR